MILLDTDLASALAKAKGLDLIIDLFRQVKYFSVEVIFLGCRGYFYL